MRMPVRRSRRRLRLLVYLAPVFLSTVPLSASGLQTADSSAAKKVLTIDDYSRWRSISGSEMSPDGRWVAYEMRHTNLPSSEARPTLYLSQLEPDRTVEIAGATGAAFSDDSRWIAYSIEPENGGRGGRGGRGGGAQPQQPPPNAGGRGGQSAAQPRKVELRDLTTGAVRSWEDIQSFSFASGSGHLLLLRRRQGGGNSQGRGVDAILHNLTSGRDLLLGSVGDAEFNHHGDLLAYTVDASVRDGNGLFVVNLQTSATTPLDNAALTYSRLTWNDSGTALAVLKGDSVEKMRERSNVLLVYRDVHGAISEPDAEPMILDPARTAGFPSGWVVSERATLSWSEDESVLFFGIKEQSSAPDTSGRRGADYIANVDVWNTADERIQSVQMNRADSERNATLRQAVLLANGQYVQLTDSTMRDVSITGGRWLIGTDSRGYASDTGRAHADIYRVDSRTGERTRMLKGHATSFSYGTSPDGRYYVYWQGGHFHAMDLDSMVSRPLTRNTRTSFADSEYDHPGERPPFGIVGYTEDAKSVILEHRYDMYDAPLNGSAPPRNLTGGIGTREEIRFSYVRTEPAAGGGRGGGAGRGIDLSKPVLLAAYGEWTKKAGFYELRDGAMRELVMADAAFSTPRKADKADRFLYTRQSFTEYPDLYVSGPGLTDARRISEANPQQSEYAWGRRILFEFRNKSGQRLQGTLAIPDDYQPGERRPMLVNFYEKNSQNLNRYMSPSYLSGMGSLPIEALSKGYLLMQPDVHFRTGSSHSDMLECVEAAVRKVIAMGYADPARIGINGHSYGGEGAAFIGTRSRLFAAVGMGAGVTDLTSDFSHNWGWSYQVSGGSGANGSEYYVNGQGRWGTNPWDDPELFRFESARSHVREVTAPFLIMHGTADPTVAFQEGLGFYNALRFNGKSAILLAYPGEGHSLRGLANRRDLTIRYMEFFDHYLKGEPAPKWITDGVPFLSKEGGAGGGLHH